MVKWKQVLCDKSIFVFDWKTVRWKTEKIQLLIHRHVSVLTQIGFFKSNFFNLWKNTLKNEIILKWNRLFTYRFLFLYIFINRIFIEIFTVSHQKLAKFCCFLFDTCSLFCTLNLQYESQRGWYQNIFVRKHQNISQTCHFQFYKIQI